MLKIQDLALSYQKEKILSDLFLHVKQGEIHTIIGNNGCGKSTLLKGILNIAPIEKGHVFFQNKDLFSYTKKERAVRIAYLPQSPLTPSVSVQNMVLYGRFPHHSFFQNYNENDAQIVQEILTTMHLSHLQDALLPTLSCGMRQKVYIAMVLAQSAPLILMDEPTSYLDIQEQLFFMSLLKQMKKNNKTMLLVLHDIVMALKISDRISIIDQGKILCTHTPHEMINHHIIEQHFGIKIGQTTVHDQEQFFYCL